jgi:hypothetical protein
MERREFVRGVGGLVIITALTGVAASLAGVGRLNQDAASNQEAFYITSDIMPPQAAVGPLMVADIVLTRTAEGVQGHYGATHLFTVDALGAELIQRADGSRSIEDITAEVSSTLATPLGTADAASFFVTLGQSGYLQNQVLVALYENRA